MGNAELDVCINYAYFCTTCYFFRTVSFEKKILYLSLSLVENCWKSLILVFIHPEEHLLYWMDFNYNRTYPTTYRAPNAKFNVSVSRF
jgi:hypothetical protein